MRTFPVPFNEEARLCALFQVPGLRDDNSAVFDALGNATRTLLGCPIAQITVVEAETQWCKSVVGLDLETIPRDYSFCAHAIMSDEPMIVPDLREDHRFQANPATSNQDIGLRFYAGVPLVLTSGYRLGTLSVLDTNPRHPPSPHQIEAMKSMADAVVAALESSPPAPSRDRVETDRNDFVTLIGHELRTPLTVLMGSLRMLEHDRRNSTDITMARAARKSAEHLIRMVETIITYGRADTGELHLNETSVDLDTVIAEAIEIQTPHAAAQNTNLTFTSNDDIREILIDAEQIQMAVTALLLNSIHHGGENIEVSAGQDPDGNVAIEITDDGALGDEVDIASLYQPFVVGGELMHRGATGNLGLGLPLTRKLAELHGGELKLRSVADRTIATLLLPAWRSQTVTTQ